MPWRRPAGRSVDRLVPVRHGVVVPLRHAVRAAHAWARAWTSSAQWRRFVATGEYIFLHAPSGNQQGATLEPGVTLWPRRLDVAARGAGSAPRAGTGGAPAPR